MAEHVTELRNKNGLKTKKKIIGKFFTIIVGTLVAILLVTQLTGTITAQSNYGVPRFGDYQTLIVLTDSMEPALPVDGGIIVKRVPLDQIKASTSLEAKDGDVLTFYRKIDGIIVTHRVIEVLPQDDGSVNFKTLGDNLNAQTCPSGGCNPDINFDIVKGEYVLGIVVYQSTLLGQIVQVGTNPLAIVGVVLIPLLYVFFSSVADIIRHGKMKEEAFEDTALTEFEDLKQKEKLRLLIEMEKEKMRKALIKKDDIEKTEIKEGDKNV